MPSMQAFVDDYGKVTVTISRLFFGGKSNGFYICDATEQIYECTITGFSEADNENRYELSYAGDLDFSVSYYLREEHGLSVPLHFRNIAMTERFDREFTYEKDDLGSYYHTEYTDFALWAPTASQVLLRYTEKKKTNVVVMKRTEKGVYRCRVEGDLKTATYVYLIERNGTIVESLDPYAISGTANGLESAVIDTREITAITDPGVTSPLKNECDAIIYECNVRDMTSSPLTGTITNGKYVSLCEAGTSYGGEPTGLDYLSSLGVTHVQLQPVIDFATVDELHANRNYNWGYDPSQIFALEGSYATKPNDPYSRVCEFRLLVATLHKRNIRVNLDVVWNHMYETANNALGKAVPYYYYRVTENNLLSNGSYCGNDLESRRPMMRHLLKHAVRTLMTLYGIDGLRFDLMGILDIETMRMLASEARAVKADAMIYGEGWDMPTSLPAEEKTMIYNQGKAPEIGHFNDFFRDILKGKTGDHEKYDKGYLTGSREHCFGACSALTANVVGDPYYKRFTSPSQSINAIETHDNATLWDKMHACCVDEPRDVRILRQKTMIAATMFAQGVPFLHAGMEFAGSKQDNSNSYNAGDAINQMNWDRRIMNNYLVAYTKKCIALRRSHEVFRLTTAEEVEKRVHFSFEQNGTLFYDIDGKDFGEGMIRVIFNPNRESQTYYLGEDWKVLFNETGDPYENKVNTLIVPMCSVFVLQKENG